MYTHTYRLAPMQFVGEFDVVLVTPSVDPKVGPFTGPLLSWAVCLPVLRTIYQLLCKNA